MDLQAHKGEKMSQATKIEIDCTTGVIQEIELTEQEITEREMGAQKAEEARQEELAQQIAHTQAKANAMEKLKALGLSEDEINTLL